MKNEKAHGFIKFNGIMIHFSHDGECLKMKTGVPREPSQSERDAISEFGEDLDTAIKRIIRKVDMSEARDAAMKGMFDTGTSARIDDEDFRRFVADLNEKLNGESKNSGPDHDFFRRMFGRRDGR